MWGRTLLIGLAGAAVVSCTARMTPQERAVEEQVVRDRTTAWVRALNNRAVDSLATFYLQTPALTAAWPGGQRTNGWEEEAGVQRDYLREIRTLNFVAQDVRVEVLGAGAALATFRTSADEIRGTERDLFTGQGTLVWVRPEPRGPWVIRAQHLSRTPSAPPPPAQGRR